MCVHEGGRVCVCGENIFIFFLFRKVHTHTRHVTMNVCKKELQDVLK